MKKGGELDTTPQTYRQTHTKTNITNYKWVILQLLNHVGDRGNAWEKSLTFIEKVAPENHSFEVFYTPNFWLILQIKNDHHFYEYFEKLNSNFKSLLYNKVTKKSRMVFEFSRCYKNYEVQFLANFLVFCWFSSRIEVSCFVIYCRKWGPCFAISIKKCLKQGGLSKFV